MQHVRAPGIAALALLVAASLAVAGEPSADDLIKEFQGGAEARQRSPKELEAAYATMLDALVPKIAGESPQPRQQPEQALQAICWRAGRPGAEAERLALCRAMAARLGAKIPTEARTWLTKQLLHIGRDECIDALAPQLDDGHPRVREWTRRALQTNPSPRAADALRKALARAKQAEWRVALINALACKPGKATVQALIPLAGDAADEVRSAAVTALGKLGDKAGADAIADAMAKGSPRAKAVATDSYLLLADGLCEQDDKAAALAIYRRLLAATGHIRCAAIIGLGRAGGVKELPTIFEALASDDPRERGAGLQALELLPPQAVLLAIQDKLGNAPPAMKVALLRALLRRADKAVLPAFIAAAGDANAEVRTVAYEGMGKLQDPKAAPVLIAALLKAQGAEQGAVQQAINRVPGKAMTDALIAALGKAEPKARVQIVRILALREAEAIAPMLLELAEKDADASVRSEAFKALTDIADASALPHLVTLMVGAKEAKDRGAAERAVATVARQIEDESARTKPILAALGGADTEARCSLLRVAARLGGADALKAIRAARGDANAKIQDTAIRALAKWDTPEVADDLLDLAKNAKSLAHRVVALDAYVRVVGLMGGKPTAELLRMYEAAMAAAPRPEDRKRVLSGMAQVGNLGALRMAQQYLDDPKLRAEAELAVVSIATAIIGSHKAEAKAALDQIVKTTKNGRTRNQAQQAFNLAEKFEDYIVSWQVSGPYGNDFNKVFPPEDPKAKAVKWQAMPVGTTASAPWRIEPDHVDSLRGNNRLCYVRTRVYSPKTQKVRMELGSDDGVKVWIAGKLLHANNASRPCRPGEDKKTVELPQGWSDLMVKLTQGGGEWAFCIRFRQPDGAALDGLRAQVGGGQ